METALTESRTDMTSAQGVGRETRTSQQARAPVMTAQELVRLPDDGQRYELIKGELTVMTPASARHGRIANTIAFLLTLHVRQHSLGVVYAAETGFKLQENPDTVRAADAAFVAQGRIPTAGEPQGYWDIAPDLVVEVVSPSDSAPAIQSKVMDWLTAGSRVVWVIYPDTQTVIEYRSLEQIQVLTAEQTLAGGDVLPEFSCAVNEIFA
jgi:Uma2 family endonuclease